MTTIQTLRPPVHAAVAALPQACPAGVRIAGDGPAIVLLHSSMASKSQWRSLMEHLSGRYRLIAIDLYGYGEAPMPPRSRGFCLADEATRIRSLLAQLLDDDACFHLVGHSFGGAVALRLAHAMPKRVSSLALFEPTAFHLVTDNDAVLDEVRAVAAATALAATGLQGQPATARFIDFWGGEGAYAAQPAARRLAFAGMLKKTALDFQALFNDPLRPADYRALRMPVCLLEGRDSPRCAAAVIDALMPALPLATLHKVAGGHMAPLTNPAAVNALVAAFVDSVEAHGRRHVV